MDVRQVDRLLGRSEALRDRMDRLMADPSCPLCGHMRLAHGPHGCTVDSYATGACFCSHPGDHAPRQDAA